MTNTEIKKALYKEKPIAQRIDETRSENDEKPTKYRAVLSDASVIYFNVPSNEAEGFDETMPAQLLIRWMI